jgi:hypothetical protein
LGLVWYSSGELADFDAKTTDPDDIRFALNVITLGMAFAMALGATVWSVVKKHELEQSETSHPKGKRTDISDLGYIWSWLAGTGLIMLAGLAGTAIAVGDDPSGQWLRVGALALGPLTAIANIIRMDYYARHYRGEGNKVTEDDDGNVITEGDHHAKGKPWISKESLQNAGSAIASKWFILSISMLALGIVGYGAEAMSTYSGETPDDAAGLIRAMGNLNMLMTGLLVTGGFIAGAKMRYSAAKNDTPDAERWVERAQTRHVDRPLVSIVMVGLGILAAIAAGSTFALNAEGSVKQAGACCAVLASAFFFKWGQNEQKGKDVEMAKLARAPA